MDANYPAAKKPTYIRSKAMEGLNKLPQTGNGRRALKEIKNYMGAAPFPPAVIKRDLSGKPSREVNEEQPTCHRPVTRGFAVSYASKQTCYEIASHGTENIGNERQKKRGPSISSTNDVEDFTEIDLNEDEDMEIGDLPLPPYLKQTEAMLAEADLIDNCVFYEVEMEDMKEESLPDIDNSDKKNPLAVVNYVEDIYSYYWKTEGSTCVCPSYMSRQSDINEKMRAILIDWLIEVHYKFELMDETLYLMVNLIDRFLECQIVVRKKLQLVGITAMLLACKYEEVTVPVVEDLILISDRAYTREEVLAMEKLMVNTLQFNLSVPTVYVFMRRFLKATLSEMKELGLLAFFLVELCLVEYEMLKYPPSLLAASAVYTAQCTLNGFRHWSSTSERHSNYCEHQLLECSKLMAECHKRAATSKLTAVHRKYSTLKFGYTARVEPAQFLMNGPGTALREMDYAFPCK